MSEKYNRLLYIDDEENNLINFKMLFKRDFEVLTANSAVEAIAILDRVGEIPVIITDQRMPGMSGIEFLGSIISKFPDTIRIILTGYIDSDALIEAINTGKVYRYIVKPWDIHDLKQTVVTAVNHYQLNKRNQELLTTLKSANVSLEEKNQELQNALNQLKQTQDILIAQERRASIGDLAAGLSHELKNQLNTIGLLELFRDELSDENKGYVDYVFDMRSRILDLINEVRAIAKEENLDIKMENEDFSKVLDETLFLAKLDLDVKGKTIILDMNHKHKVLINKNKMIQVLLNLIRNAAHAIENRKEGYIKIQTEENDKNFIIHVIDNGMGMDELVLQNIWNMFFSTKGKGGTGIGLDICKKIVESHYGTLTCTSEVNKGSQFTINLPLK